MQTLEEAVANKDVIRLHLGCGDIYLGDWINCDLENPKADVKLDCRKIPLPDNSVQEIYNSHLLEHFDFKEAWSVLKEWHRVLKPGGKLITETPDLLGLCQEYVNSSEPHRVDMYGLFFGCPWLEEWNIHKFLYSETQLRWTLEQTGFTDIKRVVADSHFVPPDHQAVFLKLEAVKPRIYKVTWPCSQKPIELEMLQEFFLDQGAKIKNVLEIGVYYGGTSLLWAKMVKPLGGRVVSLDSSRFNGKYIYEDTEFESVITFVQGDSHLPETREKVELVLDTDFFDMLFIDGDHTKKGARADFLDYIGLVKPGGWVVFHDILDTQIHREAGCYVSQYWKEIRNNYDHWQIIDPADQSKMGIGVLHV